MRKNTKYWGRKACLFFYDQQGFIKIQIIDSGAGISQSDIGKLFNPFSQTGNSRKYIYIYINYRKFGGTGLGLWISDNIIKKMGGSLKVYMLTTIFIAGQRGKYWKLFCDCDSS